MKHLIARTLTSLTLAVVGLAVTAPAQSAETIQASIPFEFSFGDQTFPAGKYTLGQPLQHLLVLRDSRGKAIAQAFTQRIASSSPADETKLRFYFSGGQHTLVEVWQQDSSGERLYSTESRKSVAKHARLGRAKQPKETSLNGAVPKGASQTATVSNKG